MPPAYVGAPLVQPSADAGTCILTPNSVMIRPKIGGSRKKRKNSKKNKRSRKNKNSRRQRAGFLPSIGEPFAAAAGKYVAPIALYGLYKFLDKTKTGRRATTSRKSRNGRKGRRV